MAGKKLVTLVDQRAEGYSLPGERIRGVAVADVRVETSEIKLSLVNLAPITQGSYSVLCGDENRVSVFPLKSCSSVEFTVDGNASDYAIIVLYEDKSLKTIVAYGGFSPRAKKAEEILEYAENLYQQESGYASSSKRDECDAYDDEVVATENYYGYQDVDEIKLAIKEEYDGANGGEYENGDAKTEFGGQEAARGDFCGARGDEIEEEPSRGDYYQKIKPRLDDLFEKFPREDGLSRVVPDSKWVKISYDDGKYYVVGVLTDGKTPSYICYGVAGRYGERPKEIDGYCSFIPSSLFSLKGDGFWVMYQDAKSGERITVDG